MNMTNHTIISFVSQGDVPLNPPRSASVAL
jgi:hypothetical protein